ncbi:MAG: 4Fe-4S binding protein [Anaerolineae bacterium]|nr:4Fe-4S binding protein [Anaerolineae bacterium]
MSLVEEFIRIFDVWEPARLYLSMMVDEAEMALVVAMDGEAITAAEVARRLALPEEQARALLERAYRRGIVNRSGDGGTETYKAADFYSRLDVFAKFENWDDIPPEARKVINRRYLDEYIAHVRPKVEQLMAGATAAEGLHNNDVLLLREVEEMLDAATDIVVQPCDCRRLGQNCDRPVETCLWLDKSAREALDRGHGRRLTVGEAKALVRHADRKGLMHTGDSQWRANGLSPICNCCACDCYPFNAAREIGSKGVWPRSRYVAAYDRDACSFCGLCVKRCHFGAFYHDGAEVTRKGTALRDVQFDPAKCWGCGLCANSCPTGAIAMRPLNSTPDRMP